MPFISVPNMDPERTLELADPEALQRASAWQQAILDSADFTIISTNVEGLIQTCNAVALKKLGYTADEVIGKMTPAAFHDPGEIERRARELSQELGRTVEPGFETFVAKARLGIPDESDWTYVRKDGSRFPVRLSVTALFDEAGRLSGFLGIGKDVTAQKAAEEALRESEERFKAFMDNSPVVAFIKDEAGRYLYVNKPAERRFNLPLADWLDRTDRELWPPEIAEHLSEQDRTVLRENRPTSHLDKVPSADGASYWMTYKFPLPSGDGGEGHRLLGGMALDVTQQKLAEQAMQQNEERLSLVLHGADLGMWDWDFPTGRVIFNERWAQMLGYRLVEIPPHISSLESLVHPDDLHRLRVVLSAHLEGRTPFYETEYRLRHKSGNWVWVLDRGKVISRDAEGKPLRACGTQLDLTDRKRYEQQIAEQRRKLEEANARLEEANEKLEALAGTDELTGLINRRGFEEHLARELDRAARRKSPLSLLLLDVDWFKNYNDEFGHLAGDEVLHRLALLLRSQARSSDIVARFGGEEFAVILPDTPGEGALVLAERFRETIEAAPWPGRPMTASFGISTWNPALSPRDGRALLNDADRALYRSKGNGRNRVTQASTLAMA
jgi:diguanylate cyclase (GGDEF)-like protein/PAS domain S-box-containing protein